MTAYRITAKINVQFHLSGMPDDERESAQPTLDIEYSFVPGAAAHFDVNHGGDPGWSAEVDLIKATLVNGDGLDPTDDQVTEWARNWLDDEGYDIACQHAEDMRRPDPDEARERSREDARDFGERG